MSHELEVVAGNASFVYNVDNGDPWHALGTPVHGTMTIEQALALAHADYEVTMASVTVLTPDGFMDDPEQFSTIRLNPHTDKYQVLGRGLGKGYTIVQNEGLLEKAYAIVGASKGGAHLDTLGVLYDGKRFFFYVRTEGLVIDPQGINDPIEQGIAGYSSHDGSISNTLCFTNTRPVCKNTITMAVEGAKRVFKAKHTKSVEDRFKEAQQILGVSTKWAEKFKREAESLLAVKFTEDRFEKVLKGVFPDPVGATDRQKRNSEEARTHVRSLFVGPTNAEKFGMNGWTMYNAVGEFLDHGRKASKEDKALSSMQIGGWVEKKKVLAQKLILANA